MAMNIPFESVEQHINQELGQSDWIVVDQSMIDQFANLTNDHQWVHVDVDRANREMGGTFAHGFLTLSMIPGLIANIAKISGVGHGLNYGLDKVRFTNRVRAGTRIRARQTMLSVEPRGNGKMIKNRIDIEIENEDRPAVIAETLTLIYPAA